MTQAAPEPRAATLATVLTVGTLAVSTAAPLIELADLPALAVSAWRTVGGGALYALFAGASLRRALGLSGRMQLRLLASSALLAAHFGLWIAAFDLTSYASNVLLLVMQPVFAAILGLVFLAEAVTRRMLVGIGLALAGLFLIVPQDVALEHGLLGDAMAVLACLAMSVYLMIVRPLRRELPFRAFMALSYGVAGVLLTGLCLATETPLAGYRDAGWGWLAALILVPTVVGHACQNWAVIHVRLFSLNLLLVLEPAIAILLGAALLDVTVSWPQALGGVILATAVVVGLDRGKRERGGVQEIPPC